MALIMNDEQRAEALKEYNPKERLIPVGKDKQTGKVTLYYPAAWRLYELHLRYPNANFKSEIVYHDEQKGTVIVKAYLYLGKNYDESDKKAEAMKQGSIASLDKVETAAKARCARDFGIGTEYALDMVADETDATHDDATHQNGHNENGNAPPAPAPIARPHRTPLVQAMVDAREVGMITGTTKDERTASWEEQVIMIFGKLISADEQGKPENIKKINEAITRHKGAAKSA